MRRRTTGILTGIGIIVVVLGIVYAVAVVRATARLRRAYAALEADGRPMRATEVVPPTVPDTQNAMVLYESAAAMLKAQPAPQRNLLYYMGKLADSFWSDSPDPNTSAELRQLMGQDVVLRALSAVEQGTQRPACRLNRDYEAGVPLEMPILDDLRSLARLLAIEARLEVEGGKPDAAWNTVLAQLRFADGLRSDPLYEGQLCRTGLIGLTCRTIQRLCEMTPPGKEEYRKIDGLLKDLDDIGPLIHATDGERLLIGEWLFNLPKDQLYRALRERMFGHGGSVPEIIPRLAFRIIIFKPRLLRDHATYLELMRAHARALPGPYAPRGSDAHKEIDGLIARRGLLTELLAPMYYQDIHYRRLADVRMTRAGLALLQYRQAQGSFPPTLDALGLEKLIDPYTQEPLHYRPEGEGFVVYSVGEDLKDNGGKPRSRQSSDPRQRIPVEYDLLWRFPRSAP